MTSILFLFLKKNDYKDPYTLEWRGWGYHTKLFIAYLYDNVALPIIGLPL